ncbi:MAG: NUDIX hydrolase [Anaerolineae bacterium]|nr:NUDIX hydrolase [Anaerolineae bacterium]
MGRVDQLPGAAESASGGTMEGWKTLSRRLILDHSTFLKVEEHTVELPGGRVIADWPWLVMPDYANVVAETEDGRIICFRQGKYALQGTSLAPVGGYLEPGEEPLAAARRELLEETGYRAAEWISLGAYPVDGNRGAGTAYLFLARGAAKVADARPDDLEEQELLLLSRAELKAAINAGEFRLLSWMAAVILALHKLEED